MTKKEYQKKKEKIFYDWGEGIATFEDYTSFIKKEYKDEWGDESQVKLRETSKEISKIKKANARMFKDNNNSWKEHIKKFDERSKKIDEGLKKLDLDIETFRLLLEKYKDQIFGYSIWINELGENANTSAQQNLNSLYNNEIDKDDKTIKEFEPICRCGEEGVKQLKIKIIKLTDEELLEVKVKQLKDIKSKKKAYKRRKKYIWLEPALSILEFKYNT